MEHKATPLRHFGRSIIVGSLFALCITAAHQELPPLNFDANPINFLQWKLYDLIAMTTNLVVDRFAPAPRSPYKRIVFVDIDQNSLEAIGKESGKPPPPQVSRSYLARLVQQISRGKPAVVVIDFDITGAGPNDRDFIDALAAPDTESSLRTKFVVDHALGPVRKPNLALAGATGPCLGRVVRIIPSMLETTPSNADLRNVAYGSTEFDLDSDGVVRRFCRAIAAEYADGRSGPLESVAAIAVGMASSEQTEPQLIRFRIADDPETKILPRSGDHPFYQRVAAHALLSIEESATKDSGEPSTCRQSTLEKILCDYIVVIGESHGSSRDFHRTPLGEMPGALLVVNAIDTLQRNATLRPASPYEALGIDIVTVIVISAGVALLYWGVGNRLSRRRTHSPALWTSVQLSETSITAEGISVSSLRVTNGLASVDEHTAAASAPPSRLRRSLWNIASWLARAALFITITILLGLLALGTQLWLATYRLLDGIWLDLTSPIIGVSIDVVVHLGQEFQAGADIFLDCLWSTWGASVPLVATLLRVRDRSKEL